MSYIDEYIIDTPHGKIIDIDSIDLKYLVDKYGKDSLINDIISKIQSYEIDYPYTIHCSPDVCYLFNNLSKLELTTTGSKWNLLGVLNSRYSNTYNGLEYLSIVVKLCSYMRMDIITDIYSEKERLKCVVYGNKPPIEMWLDKDILRKVLTECINTYDMISTFSLRESLYSTRLIKYCNLYKVSIVKQVITLFNAKRIIDLSCGWGDRLIGSMGAKAECYHGCDPNVNMTPIYKEMVRDLNQGTDVNIQTVKAEDYVIKENYYDLFHSSPPFWIKEVYPDVDTTVSLDDWKVNFLYVYVKKAVHSVKKGGYITIYISEYGKIQYCNDMNDYINKMGLCEYIGCIGIASEKVDSISAKGNTIDINRYPIWVWKKIFEQ